MQRNTPRPPARTERSGLHEEMRRFFDQFIQSGDVQDTSSVVTSQWVPRVDIHEERERFVILADLPGLEPQDVEIWMDKGILSLKGERVTRPGEAGDATDAQAGENDVRFSRMERVSGRFHRRFSLPDSADADAITATGRNGVLEISIPKRPETTPRRIQVGAGRDGASGG
ncbi:Hsp20/alpha crystallin family protein [Luteimonas sp. SJ-16]|uniref:Hsp20/alpha crystallin family protein n=2 Tax=Luteimonas deserti TaxID=2752306 RepID=A0A7Z0U1A0_9GAMM|nr:Hsp20/alpha crystallin family protein [Luteimonas deserti]NYZ64118.1 Hsp20/alpha crystallin family protein [Luteimonas deserti]